MDIQLAPKKWYVKYRAYLIAGALFLVLVIGLLFTAFGPSKLRVNASEVRIAEVVQMDFVEYVNADGTLQPIQTIKVNTQEAGIVERIVAEEGSMLRQGDTIMILTNPQLERAIDDQRDAYSKQYNSYRERLIQMEQQSLTLRQQTLQTAYDLRRLEKQIALDREEYRMGIKSKAELELAEDEYTYRKQSAELQMKSLLQDSAMNVIRREMLE
ncbi:MAG: efflux RND transporter periplasmic adaptor subunit, partial [Bacteroidaceae bacterium]|nr:efflux RND transporter periplasmic adaptor subunit [Bacteroidaceae bacterium]